MTIDLNKIPLEEHEDGLPDLNELPFDLNLPVENLHPGTTVNHHPSFFFSY